MSQVSLLNDYATRHDAEAFAKLVDQYQRLIFATCRRKLHNAQDVDDAVQETFLRLAHKAGELHSNVGGWLHRCAVNVSLDMNRRRAARKKYETRAADERPEQLDDHQSELAELREHLDAALEKLDDESRELIIQRFFVGRQQTELAEEAGVSAPTMSRRIDAAIAKMREHLQAAGARKLSLAGGAGLAVTLTAETVSAAVPAALTANIMKIGLSGAHAAATAGGAGASGAGATGAGATGGGATGAATATTGTTAATVGAVAGGTFMGAVAMKVGAGIAAAILAGIGAWAVVAQTRGPSSPSAAAPASAPAALAAGLTVSAPGPGGQTIAPPVWATTQAMVQNSILEGRIVDGAGNAVANAVVSLNGPGGLEVRTDAEGRYAFTTLPAAGEYQIGVRAEGFVEIEPYSSVDPALQLTPQSKARRDVVIERGAKVRVVALDVTGSPLRGISIDANIRGADYRTRQPRRQSTDVSGQVTLALPISKSAYVIAASADSYEPAHQLVTPDNGDEPRVVEITMLPSMRVKGVAICNDGKPAAGWEVSAKPEWWASNYIPTSAPIDADGNFTLANVGSGKYELTVWRRSEGGGGSSVHNASFTFPAKEQPIRLNVPHPSPASMVKVAGRVKFIGGQPEYVSVNAQSLSDGRQYYHGNVQPNRDAPRPRPRRATTGAAATRGAAGAAAAAAPASRPAMDEGTFTLDNITPGVYRLSFESPSIESKVFEKIKLPDELPALIELRVSGKPRLSGTVVAADTGQPVAHFAVRVRKTEMIGTGPHYVQDEKWIQVSNPQGKFDLELVGPGVYQVQASVEGYAWAWSPNVRIEKAGGKGSTQIKVGKGGSLAGFVVDGAGKPVEGAKVIPLSMAQAASERSSDRFVGDAGAATTDAQGRFTLPHLSAGDESVKVVHPKFAPTVASGFKIEESKPTDAGKVALRAGGVVEGVVYDADGKPLAGQVLQFQDETGYGGQHDEAAGRLASATTDPKGFFRVEGLPEEVIYVNVGDRWNHRGVVRRVVRPLEGKTTRLDFGGTRPVAGRLLDADKKPIANKRAQLSVTNAHFGAVMVSGGTDGDGRFNFTGAPPGKYALYLQGDPNTGDWTTVRDVQVGDQPVDFGDITLDVGDAVITLTADDPAMAKSVQYVHVEPHNDDVTFQNSVGRGVLDQGSAAGEGVKWRVKSLPPGKYRVRVHLSEKATFSVSATFERKAGAAETPLTVHIPAASSTLSVTTLKAEGVERAFAILRSTLGTIQAYAHTGEAQPQALKLPPGTYEVIESPANTRRADVPPVELKPGETKSVTIPVQTGAGGADAAAEEVPVSVCLWTADGVIVTDATVSLTDAAGKMHAPKGEAGVGWQFLVPPGKYKVSGQRGGGGAGGGGKFEKDIEVRPFDRKAKRPRLPIQHIVLD